MVFRKGTWLAIVCWTVLLGGRVALAQTELSDSRLKVRDLCRLKGQEENILQGVGFVVGLKGSGDGESNKPMMRALARALQNLGAPVASDADGRLVEKEMAKEKNVAMRLAWQGGMMHVCMLIRKSTMAWRVCCIPSSSHNGTP